MGFRSGGGSGSVISLSTTKSSFGSKFSRKSNRATQDALILSQATAQALQAAKAILHAGGSEMTALKTAKAAAVSCLMPESSEKNEYNSGIGTSFLRRRKLKRQAEVVASMALASAMGGGDSVSSSTIADWEGHSLKMAQYANDRLPDDEALDMPQASSSLSEDEHEMPRPSRRESTAEMFSRHLKMIPSLSNTFSGSSNYSNSGGSRSDFESSSGDRSMARQISSFTDSTREQSMYSHMLPRHKHHGKRRNHDKCTLFPNDSGCLNHSYAEDASVNSGLDFPVSNNPVDHMIFNIMNAFSCGPITRAQRPREIRVPSRTMESIDEEDDYYAEEETITFENVGKPKVELATHFESSEETEEENQELKELSSKLEKLAEENREEAAAEYEATGYDSPFMSISASTSAGLSFGGTGNDTKANDETFHEALEVQRGVSTSGESNFTTGEDILMDLMASKTLSELQNKSSKEGSDQNEVELKSDQNEVELKPDQNEVELKLPTKSESLDEMTMVLDGLVALSVDHNEEDINYVQIVSPQRRRNRRLARGCSYNELGDNTPAHSSQEQCDAPGTSPSASRSPVKATTTQPRKNLWSRVPPTPMKAGMALFRKNTGKWRK